MSKTIAIVTWQLSGGGAEKMSSLLANLFVKEMNDVCIITLKNSNKENYILDPSIKILNPKYSSSRLLRRIYGVVHLFMCLRKKYDAVISLQTEINILTIICNFAHNNLILSERADPKAYPNGKIFRLLRKYLYKRHLIAAQTQSALNWLKENNNIKKIKVAKNIIDPQYSDICVTKTDSNFKKVLMASRLTHVKSILQSLDIFRELQRLDIEWKMDICGDGPLKVEIENKIHLEGIKNTSLHGFKINISNFYMSSTFLLLLSKHEGLPMTVIEAMHFGIVPIVSYDLNVINDLNLKENGLIIDRDNVKASSQQILELYSDKNRLKDLQYKCIQFSRKYNINSVKNDWINLLNEF